MPSLVSGVLEQRRQTEFAQHAQEPCGLGTQVVAHALGDGRVAAGLFERALVDVEIEGEEGAGAVEADGINADGAGAEQVIADDGGGEGFVNGTVAALAAASGPLAGVDVFAPGEQGGEPGAIGIAGGEFLVLLRGFVGLIGGEGTCEGGGAFGGKSGADGLFEGGAGAGGGVVVLEDGDVEGEPVLAGGVG